MLKEQFPNISIIENSTNAGFGSANNLAIKQAKGKYILCLNTDTILINNAIKIMFDFMEKEENRNVGACGGYLVDIHKRATTCCGHLPSLSDLFWKLGLRFLFKKYYRKCFCTGLTSDEVSDNQDVGYISGADLFLRKTTLDTVGIFDEHFFMYFEETDLCKRIWDFNYTIKIVKSAKIMHLEGQSMLDSLKKSLWFKQSELYYFNKHYSKQYIFVKLNFLIRSLFAWFFLKKENEKELIKLITKI